MSTLPRSEIHEEMLLSDRFYRSTAERRAPSNQTSPTTLDDPGRLIVPFGDTVIVIAPAPGDWIMPAVHKVRAMAALPPNWNSYGGLPIRADIAASALMLLIDLLSTGDPIPSVVPTSRGGILLEWHEGGIDLEVDIQSPSRFHLAFDDGKTAEEFDGASPDVIQRKLNCLRSCVK